MIEFFFSFVVLISLQLASAETLVGRVLSIHDGDTMTVQIESQIKKEKIRLLGVDTPEIEFNGKTQGTVAEMARDYLRNLLPLNSVVQIDVPQKGGRDINGRYLGIIIYNGADLNLEMLKAGMGAVYFIFPYDKKTAVTYMNASETAAVNGVGLFSQMYNHEMLGYVFRQKVRGTEGTNIVADYVTKKIYSANDLELVPHYHRVFFSSEQTALIHGFNW
jgi:micrococcal nuclease